jgi:UDP-2-acetamido-2,6-beta-L-arabino-hexul-4-ose reductase
MRRVLVTGAAGFIGQNLAETLRRRADVVVDRVDAGAVATIAGAVAGPDALPRLLEQADVVFHLAGINRPQHPEDYEGNVRSTSEIVDLLERAGRTPTIVLSSSTQAALDNPYGISKRRAEDVLRAFSARMGARVVIYRLPGVFGKWCRPNYNSVVATFCHNTARGLPITVNNPASPITLVYVDDVVRSFAAHVDDGDEGRAAGETQNDKRKTHNGETDSRADGARRVTDASVEPVFETTLAELVTTIEGFRDERRTLLVPELTHPFLTRLYATYKSYLPADGFAYPLEKRTDARGSLAEFVKSPHAGQIFVSRTKPGITRGNHFHHTKVEKFLVLEGRAVVRFRDIRGGEVLEYPVAGDEFRVVDIPPGYTHSIENVGTTELVVLFWADEIFDAARADTYAQNVRER